MRLLKTISLVSLIALTLDVNPSVAKEKEAARKPSSASPAEKLLDEATCRRLIDNTLNKWRVTREWITRPVSMDGGRSFASPTDEVGKWAQVVIYPDHSAEALLQSSESNVMVSWKGINCLPSVSSTPRQSERAANTEYFTDNQLGALARSGTKTMLFLWSPHMPLSVKAYPQAEAIARKLEVQFIPLLDPEADEHDARATAKASQFPAAALRRPESIELVFRGMFQHYPSTLILSGGKFSHNYPGIWTKPEILEGFVRENLK